MTKPAQPVKTKSASQANRPPIQEQPLVSGGWLLRAIFAVVILAVVCSYVTLCLLFYQGQWQVVFHPSRAITTTPAALGLRYDDVRFDYTQTGTPQLSGWWMAAAADAPYGNRTMLFFHDGQGSLSDVAAQLEKLHSLGINLFAFDYRGFGQSADSHPSEQRVYEDADAAWTYLTDIRHIDPKSIVLYGTGLGATIAAEAALRHRESPALVLENPASPAVKLIEADSRTSLLPIKLLFRDRFEIAPKLHALGIKLSESAQEAAVNGKPSSAPFIVHDDNQHRQGPKLLLFLGPSPANDPHYIPVLEELFTSLSTSRE
jgi:pimeloyl-ACP methyl ester carboxylesterase